VRGMLVWYCIVRRALLNYKLIITSSPSSSSW
jgi:hypothetical protein